MEIIASLIIAIAQSILLYKEQLGISMLIFMTIIIVSITIVLCKKGKIVNKKALILSIPIILLSSTYMIFSNRTFYTSNIIAMVLLSIFMFIIATIKKQYIREYLYCIPKFMFKTLDNVNTSMKLTNKTKKEKINIKVDINKIIGSLFIVISVVTIVIILLASADSEFASIFKGIGKILREINIGNLLVRIGICVVVYFIALSFILALQKRDEESNKEIKEISTDKFTIKMLLIVLNIIYLIFCYIQITSLFTNINSVGTFNYAKYAKTGFFQLMFVSFINFILILISNRNNGSRGKLLKILNSFLILFTIIILVSSIFRMYMYETAYGLTYLRLFVYIILAAELLIFIPTIVYVYNSKFDLLKWGGIISIIVYVVINFANLENIIITRNLSRINSNVDIDYNYISKIATSDSFDKLENLQNKLSTQLNIDLENLKDLNENVNVDKCKDLVNVMQAKVRILSDVEMDSWQEFNISKNKVLRKYDSLSEKKSDLKSNITDLNNLVKRIKKAKNLSKAECKYNKMINDDEGYAVYEIDHAVGQAVWQIEKTIDGGENYNIMRKIDVTTPSQIEFFENGLGFLMKPDSINCAKSDLYITTNSGKTFTKLKFPIGKFSLSNSNGKRWQDCYDYFFLPTREKDGTFTVLVSGGYEGGYNEGKTRAKYISIDSGRTWNFIGEVYK